MIYNELPSDFNKKLDVVACYIEFTDEFILLHRQPYKTQGNKWGLPAGKVDDGETLQKAMLREIYEETKILLEESQLVYIGSLMVRHDDLDFEYHMFKTILDKAPEIIIDKREHQSATWVSPEKALTIDLISDLDECIRLSYKL
jgi:8-oxo-dGTP diphosphatase